jgi:hypothetical protein
MPDPVGVPADIQKYIADPGLISVRKKEIEDQAKELAKGTVDLTKAAADKTKLAVEDTVAASIQMATTTKMRVETALKAILSSSLVNPLGGD